MEVICFSGSDGQEHSDIHMLIGADFFWHIVSGNVKRGEHGHIAMETKLGYVLSGPETTPDTSDDTGGGGGGVNRFSHRRISQKKLYGFGSGE